MLTYSPWLSWLREYVNSIFTSHRTLTLAPWLCWLRKYVNSIFHKPPNADILPVVVLA